MIQDHFVRHNHYDGVVDWNFNVIFSDQPAVAAMAVAYEPLLKKPYFYKPIPKEWLHATILRVGSNDEYTEAEMVQVAHKVQKRLRGIEFSEFHFGQHIVIHGNVCFKIEPESELEKLYTIVIKSLEEVVGTARATKSPYGHFIAHASLVYSKERDNIGNTETALREVNIEPAKFYIHHMPLIKQWPTNGHYEWDVIRDITIE